MIRVAASYAVIAWLSLQIADVTFEPLGVPRWVMVSLIVAAADGEILALGIAESVLHQLANLRELDVISRTSSFAFRDTKADARNIGQQLGARYLLEGSVQSEATRMRVTTQLIDTQTGADVWSMRFDRAPGDVFAIQDEIAVQVTRALELSLAPDAMERMTGQGTENLEAYLAFLQGRSLLATNRVTDARKASAHFERAVSLDPGFAAAYLGIAAAGLFVAEFEVTDDRQNRFGRARRRGELLVEKALSIDPANGDAYLQRAYLSAFTDLASAEADYRRGLELAPNSAEGHADLAAVLYATPARRDEALKLLDRARKLDPLQPGFDVRKAVFLYDERGDLKAAGELLDDVVARNPGYTPALARLCEVRQMMGDTAAGIRYCEEALELDPLLEDTRRDLVYMYTALGELGAAEQVVKEGGGEEFVLRALPVLLHRHDWRRAGEVAYQAFERRTDSPFSAWFAYGAIRMHARATGEYERAEAVLEAESGIRWDAGGNAVLPVEGSPVRAAAIGLADILTADSQDQKARKLLAAILGRMKREVGELGRPETWYYVQHPVALAMNGDGDATVANDRAGGREQNERDQHLAALRDRARLRGLARGPAVPGGSSASAGAFRC